MWRPAHGRGGSGTWRLILERCIGGKSVSVDKQSVIHPTTSQLPTPPTHRRCVGWKTAKPFPRVIFQATSLVIWIPDYLDVGCYSVVVWDELYHRQDLEGEHCLGVICLGARMDRCAHHLSKSPTFLCVGFGS